jgi:hypothetical protein
MLLTRHGNRNSSPTGVRSLLCLAFTGMLGNHERQFDVGLSQTMGVVMNSAAQEPRPDRIYVRTRSAIAFLVSRYLIDPDSFAVLIRHVSPGPRSSHGHIDRRQTCQNVPWDGQEGEGYYG